ncbi:hypothetical protein NONO_c62840 [Nocardia nova SH22a]|uniref:DUF397 domain-containing protein n=1 Tax=Nocardia nova SH22a TaxID=1415166 RepID=W5TPI3_9NOCA|nr:DUF397 domain-containing protein [Nocardia nova]AHH21054.1 hypothetical protein NONO_c62840 [Nocardia nova SH22a]
MSTWFKSTFSGGEKTCVEVAHRSDAVLIRDSKYTGRDADQPIITVPPVDWPAFLSLAAAGDSGIVNDELSLTVYASGNAVIACGETSLAYNAEEWEAFAKGIAAGEFDRL